MKNQRVPRFLGGVAMAAIALFALVAGAAGESVSVQTALRPIGKAYYKELRVPMQSSISARVEVPPGQATILPIKRVTVSFDRDMTFNPDDSKTPVCPDSKINPQSGLASGISFMVDLCPRSVIGTGNALIYLARQFSAPLDDPQMVIFNAGRTSRGEPKLKIYGYSKDTNTGILMNGFLTSRGVMDVAVPVLSFDSAVGRFQLDIPGRGMETEDAREPDGLRTIRGLDPAYVRAKCTDGLWTSGARFTLGQRDPSSGADSGPASVLDAPAFNDPCQGLPGRPRLVVVRKSYPKTVRRGSRPAIRVTVRNAGTATARKIRLSAGRGARGTVRAADMPPAVTRTLTLRPRVIARQGSVTPVAVKVGVDGSSVGFVVRVRVR